MTGHIILLDESVFPKAMWGSTHIINHLPQQLLQRAQFVAIVHEDKSVEVVKDRSKTRVGEWQDLLDFARTKKAKILFPGTEVNAT